MDEWDKVVPLNVHTFFLKRKTLPPQWAFKLNSALATAEDWHLKGHTLKFKSNLTLRILTLHR
jgi:hypothetical protein